MILRWLLAWAHLIALGIGLGAVRALNRGEIPGALVVLMVLCATAMARGVRFP